MVETMVPLRDIRSMNRTNSRGSEISLEDKGEKDTLEYRVQAIDPEQKQTISLWHDINLFHINPETKENTPYMNFVCEIPKFTR